MKKKYSGKIEPGWGVDEDSSMRGSFTSYVGFNKIILYDVSLFDSLVNDHLKFYLDFMFIWCGKIWATFQL